MYVRVFTQILESSIARDYDQRHLFEDLLKLADREGVVDMTVDAIARRLNVPEAKVEENIRKLEQPDPDSRSQEEEGRRLVRLADHRDWGWQIVNYKFYRDLIDKESLRVSNRDRKRRERERKRHDVSRTVRDNHSASQEIPHLSSSSSLTLKDEKSSLNGSVEPVQTALPISVVQKPKKGPMMNGRAVEELADNPAYKGIDVYQESHKFKLWCETNGKNQSVRRFVNWLNRIT